MEAIAIVIPFIVAAAIYLWARMAPSSPWKDAAEELAQLRDHQENLRERMARGQREGWDEVMLAQVADRLAEVDSRVSVLAKSQVA